MPAQTTERERRTNSGRRTSCLRGLAGVLYFAVTVQLVGGFLIPPDGGSPAAVMFAGVVAAVAALALLGAAMLAAALGGFTAGAAQFTHWLLGFGMLSAGGPSAALVWLSDQG